MNAANPYAANKALAHMDRLRQLRLGGQPPPVHVQLILSDLCNLACSFCAYRQPGYFTSKLFGVNQADGGINLNPNRMIEADKAQEILQDAVELGVKAIEFTGGGEPTMHPQCADLVRFAHSIGLKTAFVTNGVRMGDNIRAAVLHSEWVRISLDAATFDTYGKMKNITDERIFQNVLANVQALIEERNAVRSSVYVGLSFVVNRENWRDIPKMPSLAMRLGVDNLRFAAAFTEEGEDYFAGWGDEATTLCEQAASESTNHLLITNNLSERRTDLRGSPTHPFCPYQHLTTYIGADLNVYRCCCTAYNELGLIGSLKDQSFASLWKSLGKLRAMSTFDARQCPRCQFRTRNREMRHLIEALPMMHEDFV